MTVEEQLRDYKATLDAASEAAAEPALPRGVTPIRVRPARTLVVAAVAVAATIAVAFAAVGVAHRSGSTAPAGVNTSTTPTSASSPITAGPVRVANVVGLKLAAAESVMRGAGIPFLTARTNVSCTSPPDVVTKQIPAAGSRVGSNPLETLVVCDGATASANVTLPVTVCDTVETITGGAGRPPSTIVVPASSANGDPVAGFADKQGRLVTTAPLSWTCAALDATDGGTTLELPAPTRPQSTAFDPASPSDHDGLFATSDPACQGCVHGEICGIVPNADAEIPGFDGLCAARPAGETITPLGNNVYRIEDPAGAVTPDPAISILIFHPRTSTGDASVARETCAFQDQLDVCTSLLNQFLALNR